MSMYVCLIIYIVTVPLVFDAFKDYAMRRKMIAFFCMFAVFLLLSLKAPSVGSDIWGYKQAYELARSQQWSSWDYIYYEKGYIFLNKLFSRLGVSFQLFTAILYAFTCFAWYKIIKKHSTNPAMTVLIFVCYQFLVFSISALRQTLSMAICIFAFLELEKDTLRSFLFSIVLSFCAYSVHTGALAFIAIIVAWLLSKNKKTMGLLETILTLIAGIVLRTSIQSIVKKEFGKSGFNLSFITSGNFWLIVFIFIFIYYTYYLTVSGTSKNIYSQLSEEDSVMCTFSVRISLYCILGQILFSGNTVLRSVMYITLFIAVFLPSFIDRYSYKSRTIIYVLFGAFLIALFIAQTLLPNQFQILPYKFYWE